jgi:hypothetical protein
MTRTPRLLGALITLFITLGTARADTFFVVVFGAESRPPRPKYSHSWAAFVRLPGCEACGPPAPSAGPPEVFTISWLPRAVEIHPNRPFPEDGFNFDLHTSFQIVLSQCERVMAWGPYQITPELFCRARQHAALLEGGEIRYKTIDVRYSPRRVSNCIHALTVFNTENKRLRIGRTNFGDTASYYITDSYRDWIIDPCQVHCWVADLLGLGQYPIRWRTLEQGRPRQEDG